MGYQEGGMMPRYRYLFSVEDENGETEYLDANGTSRDSDEFFIGTGAEADVEGNRRADLWERRTGRWACRVFFERRGEVKEAQDG